MKKIIKQIIVTIVLTLSAVHAYFCLGAFSKPSASPSSSNQDFLQNILGANNADNSFNSSSVAANADGSIVERLKYIVANWPADIDYGFQKNEIYDDWKGDASSTNGFYNAYTLGLDPNEEEAVWSSEYTDSSISTQYIASGKVRKDTRTGLYWSDCYDSTQGGDGACNTRSNIFTINGEFLDYDDGLDAEDGQAVDFCEGLTLASDDSGDKTDWYLPSQKELIQAIIDGFANNLTHGFSSAGVCYWTSTETSVGSSTAFYLRSFDDGGSYDYQKMATTLKSQTGNQWGCGDMIFARCVRSDKDNATGS